MSRVNRGPGSEWCWRGAVVLAALTCGCGGDQAPAASDGDSAGFVRLDVEPQKQPESPPPPPANEPEVAPVADQPPVQPAPPPSAVRPDETREASAIAALDAGAFADAARGFSALLVAEVSKSSGVDREAMRRWSAGLERAQAGHRWNRRGAWPSIEVTVEPGDSLIAIRARVLAAHPRMLLCTGLIARSNELRDEAAIRPGDVLRIPTDAAHILVDISAMWALYMLGDEVAAAWEVGVGKDASPTRPGVYTVGLKQKDPMWSPVGRTPVPYGDPQNPLGTRWMAWYEAGKNTSLGFHGTNDERGVGQRVSDGCVRMRNQDVEALFEILPKDAPVQVQQ